MKAWGTNEKSLPQIAESVYRYMTGSRYTAWGMNLEAWDWVPGVGVISILHYFDTTGDEQAKEYLLNWVQRTGESSKKAKVINAMAPYAIFPRLYELSGDRSFLEEADRIGRWIVEEAPRTREGALEHTVTENAAFPEQVWADTIFMAVLFLARLARATGNAAYAGEALEQLQLHLRLLQDETTGVLFHGWNCAEANHMSGARWTRGNAWICVGVPAILQETREMADTPDEVAQRYLRMVDGLLAYQNGSGLWHTVMDRTDFYEETSGSAGIACGLLLSHRLGLLPERYLAPAVAAVRGVLAHVTGLGEVTNVSSGTPVMPTIEAYNTIPRCPTLYGQGLTLMMLSECIANDSAIGRELLGVR